MPPNKALQNNLPLKFLEKQKSYPRKTFLEYKCMRFQDFCDGLYNIYDHIEYQPTVYYASNLNDGKIMNTIEFVVKK